MGFRSTGECTICGRDLPEHEEYTHKYCRERVRYESPQEMIEIETRNQQRRNAEKRAYTAKALDTTRLMLEELIDKGHITGAMTIGEIGEAINKLIREYR